MKIAFYKHNTRLLDKSISLWTGHKYSHCELIQNEYWYTSSWIDGGVRRKIIYPNSYSWDIYEFSTKFDEVKTEEFIIGQLGKGYDIKGIFLSQVIELNMENKTKWFCSELVHRALVIGGYPNIGNTSLISPGKLYNLLLPTLINTK
jgi:hypothetical protein